MKYLVFKATDTIGAGLLDGEGLYKGLRTLGLEVPISEGGIESLLRSVNRHEEGYIDSDDFITIVSNLMTTVKSKRYYHYYYPFSQHVIQ